MTLHLPVTQRLITVLWAPVWSARVQTAPELFSKVGLDWTNRAAPDITRDHQSARRKNRLAKAGTSCRCERPIINPHIIVIAKVLSLPIIGCLPTKKILTGNPDLKLRTLESNLLCVLDYAVKRVTKVTLKIPSLCFTLIPCPRVSSVPFFGSSLISGFDPYIGIPYAFPAGFTI